ncbi:VOC family protein [Streptomyces sp. NPDC088197]|uniref:VOC family protein n=1 Tax=unclassified Streptomyces TaxID=2593676 RepID=UPI0033B732AD
MTEGRHVSMLTTDSILGSATWIDIAAKDTVAAAGFYGAVFDWTFHPAGPDAGSYGTLQKDGKIVAALGPLVDEGATPAWTVYFETPDVEATAKAVAQAGGAVRAEPFDARDAARMAAVTDPGGAEFALFQPKALKGLETTSVYGSLGWVELQTADPAAALEFYRGLFGWRGADTQVGDAPYTFVSTSEGDQGNTAFGGITAAQEGVSPRWVPYFDVADADDIVTRVQGAGGTVLVPTVDVPGIGRIAWFADPSGATFAVLQPA